MANKEINAFTAKTVQSDTDEFIFQETGGGTTKKITRANMFKNINFLSLGAPEEKTIASGAITITQSYVAVTAQTTAADDLDTINGTSNGDIIVLTRSGSEDVTVKDAVDNLLLEGDFVMNQNADTIVLINRGGTNLQELSRSNNT